VSAPRPGRGDYALASLGDVVEALMDGWRLEQLHYADSSDAGGPGRGPAAVFLELALPTGDRRNVYVPDDGRALSHRSLVAMAREHPHIWKHRDADSVAGAGEPMPEGLADPDGRWGEVPEPFPEAVVFGPGTLRGVVALGQVITVDAVTIALVALERHVSAARVRVLAHTSDAALRGPLTMMDVLAVDDAGRRYATALTDARSEGNRLEADIALAPAIPRRVGHLTITVGTVCCPDQPLSHRAGPWVFPAVLPPLPL
jgi:hypothetical protein